MRLLVNENVTGTVIFDFRRRGYDVLSVKESMRSEADDAILARAQADGRIVVTHDKDFGELAFRSHRWPGHDAPCTLRRDRDPEPCASVCQVPHS